MIDIEEKTVAEVVAQNIKTAHVFKKYGIDFCCGGNVGIKEVCDKKQVNYTSLKDELQHVDDVQSREQDYNRWELDFLTDYIINTHHSYVEESMPIMLQYANKVAKVHGKHAPEVVEINKLVSDIVEELTQHMKKEEEILFPLVKDMVNIMKNGDKTVSFHCGSLNNPIRVMEIEHENAGDVFKKIAELSNNYQPPEWACNTYRALYAKLEEFEQDLHQHIHLENNILFPKAVVMEEEMIARFN
ncbi:MAG: iron-sulfur cluster repair di-iron protein [Cyclobacteriaceae bacterium]|nr:iron-sulfur cluster repair di-iron protein [Cyclobacteriaceae bacterium]